MPLPRAVKAGAVLAAVALGFGASQAVVARDRLPGDVLALEANADDARLVPGAGGGLVVSLPVTVRNAGPRAVVLDDASVSGSTLADDAVRRRPLDTRASTQVQLQRPLDCDAEVGAELSAPPPLTLTADGRTVALRIDDGLREADALARRSCGLLPPGQALELEMTRARVVHGIARLGFDVRSTSAEPLELRELTPARGLRVRLVDPASGDTVRLPLVVPPAGAPGSPPSAQPPPAALRLTAVVIIDDCGSPLPGSAFRGGPVFSLAVADSSGVESASFGELGTVIGEMEAESCP